MYIDSSSLDGRALLEKNENEFESRDDLSSSKHYRAKKARPPSFTHVLDVQGIHCSLIVKRKETAFVQAVLEVVLILFRVCGKEKSALFPRGEGKRDRSKRPEADRDVP